MEASLLATYPGLHLPERWQPFRKDRDPGAPSVWRLARLVRHLPPDSALAREVAPSSGWSSMHQVIDDSRRYLAMVLGAKELPAPHPMSPFAEKSQTVLTADRIAVLRAAKKRAEAREAALVRSA